MNRLLLWFGLLSVLAGCTTEGGQTGDENTDPECVVVTTTPLAEGELSPADFGPSDILPLVEGDTSRPLTWMDEGGPSYGPEHGVSTINLNVSAEEPVSARWVDLEPDGETTDNILRTCPDRLEVDVSFSVATDGGALEENLTGVVVAHQANEAGIDANVPLDAVAGTLTVDLPSGSQATLRVVAGFDSDGTTGAVRLAIEGQDGDSASFQDVRIANW